MNRNSLTFKFIKLTVLPMMILELLILVVSYGIYNYSMNEQVNDQLKMLGMTVLDVYDSMYVGDYHIIGNDSYVLMKGDDVINGDFQFLDSIKEDTGVEISIFYSNTRFLTTLCSDGERMIGTTASPLVKDQVIIDGKEKFYDNTNIGGEKYFSYYRPIYNSQGEIVGMIEISKASELVSGSIWGYTLPILIISTLMIVTAGACAVVFTRRLVEPFKQIEKFSAGVIAGNLSSKLESSVLKREDEIGRMANSLLEMQKSIKVLVEEDALTGLHNRRFGENQLKYLKDRAPKSPDTYALAVADIDFFKTVNDRYGHKCGDLVLKTISNVIKNAMHQYGFVVRWGGEEFLLVFEHMDDKRASEILINLIREIRDTVIMYKDEEIHVTMSLGVVGGNGDSNLDELFKKADSLLYEGKMSGRDCVVMADGKKYK